MATVAPARAPIARHVVGHSYSQVALRWAFIACAGVFAFWHTVEALRAGFESKTLSTYLPVALVLVVIAAAGVSVRFHSELPIYDRQTDVIVGGVLLLLAVAMSGLMTDRFAQTYLFSQVDMLPMGAFVLGSCVMLFGLRPAGRYLWVWVLGLFFMPVPYRVAVLALGGGVMAAGAVMVVFAGAATAVAAGRTRRRGLIAALVAVVVGGIVLIAMWPVAGTNTFIYQAIPSLAGASVACVAMYVDHRRGLDSWAALSRPTEPLKVRTVTRSGLFIVLIATAIFFIPIPRYQLTVTPLVGGLDVARPLQIPAQWRLAERETYQWVARLYGPRSVMTRDILVQKSGSSQWDNQSRPRKIAVDTIVTSRPGSLAVYPPNFVYQVSKFRMSNPERIQLPGGLVGELRTVLDDSRFLTYNLLSWMWRDDRRTARVTLMSVDDHRANAQLLQPNGSLRGNLSTMFTVLLRGDAVTQDSDPQFKDRDLLTSTAAGIIAAQVGSAPAGNP